MRQYMKASLCRGMTAAYLDVENVITYNFYKLLVEIQMSCMFLYRKILLLKII